MAREALAAALAGVLCAAASGPSYADSLRAALQACVDVKDAGSRLACFDRVMAQPAAAASTSAPSTAAPSSAVPSKTFGLPAPAVAAPSARPPSALQAKVVAVERAPNGAVTLTLDPDQVWVEQDPAGYFPIAVGDTVTIKQGALGGFLLTGAAGGHGAIRVKRLR